MRYTEDGQKALDALQTQAAHKLAEIHQLLAPGLSAPAGLDELRRASESRMAAMSPGERETFRNRAVVAMSHLERLMAEMSRHLTDISEELGKVNRQSRGVGAYHQTARMSRRNSVAL
jgi:hypothetical protein